MNKHFETLAVAAVCTIFVLSMHQSCSGIGERFSKKEEKKEIKKAKKEKQEVINSLQKEQITIYNDSIRQR